MTVSHVFITDLEGTQYVEGVYSIRNNQLGLTRSGKPFLKALIGDKTGQIAGRMWNISEQLFATLPTDGFVFVTGQTQPYQGEVQLIIQNIRAEEVGEEELRNLIPCTTRNIDEMFTELKGLMATIKHPAVKGLVDVYLDDTDLMSKFRRAPAAVMLHHAYLGGLLEHTLQLLNLANVMLPFYPELNHDLVMTGLFLHDMAKCGELNYAAGFSYSDEGYLLGHLVMGSLWLEEKAVEAAAISGEHLSRNALLVLHHIILSHHGVPEYGAARIPSTPEAIFISRLDELDAKTRMGIDHTRPGGDAASASAAQQSGNFTEKVWALDTRLYKPDPLEQKQ